MQCGGSMGVLLPGISHARMLLRLTMQAVYKDLPDSQAC